MARSTAWLSALLACLAIAACGGNTRDRDEEIRLDASIDALTPPPSTPDTSTPDAGPPEDDAEVSPDVAPPPPPPPTEGAPGSACTTDEECTDGACITEADGFLGGYCVVLGCDAGDGSGCPDGSSCIEVGGGQTACFAICDPDGDDCRMGYACASGLGIPDPICLPGCRDSSDCPAGRECDPMGGGDGNGVCFDPSARPGGPCVDETMCPGGSFCLSEEFSGYPDGACAIFDCDPTSGRGCTDDSVCVQFETRRGPIAYCLAACEVGAGDTCREAFRCEVNAPTGRSFCAAGCRSDADCDDGRECNPATGLCGPPFDGDSLGAACSGRMGCTGGTCLREVDTGYPGAYCAYLGCDPTMPDATDGCPGDGVCTTVGERLACHDGCATDAECREGYACRAVDPTRADRGNACVPACTSDSQCANDGFVCQPDGRCRAPFDPGLQGEPCDRADECPGGRCLTEAASGYPSGVCVSTCSLGPGAASCPAGSACTEDGDGDPVTGICLDTCDPAGALTCRPGYGCRADAAGVNVCQAACTSNSDCDSSRTCNAMTGRCG